MKNNQNPSAGNRGGVREGAGRKVGTRNKRTAELIASIEETGETPLEFMLGVMRNVKLSSDTRLDAAKSAAPYVHAKLQSLEVAGKDGGPIFTANTQLPTDPVEAAKAYRDLIGG